MDFDQPDLIEAPENQADRETWRQELRAWKEEARRKLGYTGAAYRKPDLRWVSSCYSCNKVMLWDETFLDHRTGKFDVERYLEEGHRVFGGYDAVVLWHAYPRIGFDERNQFDYYREQPGGLEGVRDLVREFHRRGVKIFVDYNPWDVGTRREGSSDAVAVGYLVGQIEADGVFLDTLNQGGLDLRTEVSKARSGVTFESELALPIEGLELNNASWAQWFDYGEVPGVLRNRWFEPRHMMHMIRRWDHDHTNEMHLAWMNGVGMLVWENIFGSWNGWSGANQLLLRQMLPVMRHFNRFYVEGVWTPLITTGVPGVYASEWALDGARFWTVVNRRDKPATGHWFETFNTVGERLFDLLTGEELHLAEGTIAAKGIAAVLSVPIEKVGEDLRTFLLGQRHRSAEKAFDRRLSPSPVAAPAVRLGTTPSGWLAVPAGSYEVKDHFRARECGERGYAHFDNTAYPGLHGDAPDTRKLTLAAFSLAPREVTNGEFATFLKASGYRPDSPENFLHHWVDGTPKPGSEDEPVVYVNLRDAHAYAAWRGVRLPTDAEWQVAMEHHHPDRSPRAVWNLTESVWTDGRTRFSILKGGAAYEAKGSPWYADGGVRGPDFSAKFIHMWDGLDRCVTVGFRCAR